VNDDIDIGDWTDCWQCFGHGMLAGCFEDTCVCDGDAEDPDYCCAPSKCDVCRGKGGWRTPEPHVSPPLGERE
jgi:hypothetical protein